ncbi:MAG TPA: dockerin type I domain-containing protein [Opitutus sp.]|nr:dockerin type I domain-containing protein [Opitutus sp.]
MPATFAAKAAGPKAKAMAQFDLNRDGKLDATEVAAVQKAFAANPTGDLQRFDLNQDGKLNDQEIAAMVPGSGKKDRGASKAQSEPKKAKASKSEKSGKKASGKSEGAK